MIFYFSGTGNSLWAAQQIAAEQGEQLVSIAAEMKKGTDRFCYTVKPMEMVGFVYPVHAWAPPKLVLDFIARLQINSKKAPFLFSVATCGESEGCTEQVLRKALKERGLSLNWHTSMVMPNNYIVMFDVDHKPIEKAKLIHAGQKIKEINAALLQRGVLEYHHTNAKDWVQSHWIRPLFWKFALDARPFYATDACIGCGLCAQNCPIGTVTMAQNKPVWGKECTMCLACIHHCPVRAIEYGTSTQRKGRYVHPSQPIERTESKDEAYGITY